MGTYAIVIWMKVTYITKSFRLCKILSTVMRQVIKLTCIQHRRVQLIDYQAIPVILRSPYLLVSPIHPRAWSTLQWHTTRVLKHPMETALCHCLNITDPCIREAFKSSWKKGNIQEILGGLILNISRHSIGYNLTSYERFYVSVDVGSGSISLVINM